MFRSRIPIAAGAGLAVAVLAAAVLLVSFVGAASASPSAVAAGAKPATINLRNTSAGKILVNKRGFTLYAFAADKRNKDKCVTRSGCTGVWPLFTTQGKPKTGKGVNHSMVGTIKVKGKMQVTYDGHPLYGYTGDFSPGSTDYVGVSMFGAKWKALNASGKLVG